MYFSRNSTATEKSTPVRLDMLDLQPLKQLVKCRDTQIDLLNAFISDDPSTLAESVIVHGFKSIGKSFTLEKYLSTLEVNYSIIRCDECITKKILLQRCYKSIKRDSGYSYESELKYVTLGENFSSFLSLLEQFIEETKYDKQHVLVLDRFDQCMESPAELFPAFAKIQEQSNITNLTVVFVISTDIPKEVITMSLPQVYFPNYTEVELVDILESSQLCFFGDDDLDSNPLSYDFWRQYIKTIVDLFYVYTGSDINLLVHICLRCWDQFIEPVLDGTFKVTEFIKVYRLKAHLFQNENLMNNSAIKDFTSEIEEETMDNMDLPIYSKYILIACYLASFTVQKNDLHFFSKVKAVKYKKREREGNKKKMSMTKDEIDNRLLTPQYFDLERMLAILSVIYRANSRTLVAEGELYDDTFEDRKEVERSKFTLSRDIDMNSQLATLYSLGMIGKSANSDILGARVRWRCNLDWDGIEGVAKDIDFPLVDYLQD